MVVTDRRRLTAAPAAFARAAAAAGASWLQVREKDLAGRALLALVREVLAAAAGSSTRIAVNGRADVARAAGAHAVHLPELGLPAGDVRRAFPELQVGVSCHDAEAVRRAEDAGAHYALLGPVFATLGKDRPLGLDALAAAVRAVRMPVLAIGGITPANAGAVWAAGVAGVAAIGAFLTPDLAAAVQRLRSAHAGAS
jgi:thiamine-phosphate pyrophosphorylase